MEVNACILQLHACIKHICMNIIYACIPWVRYIFLDPPPQALGTLNDKIVDACSKEKAVNAMPGSSDHRRGHVKTGEWSKRPSCVTCSIVFSHAMY